MDFSLGRIKSLNRETYKATLEWDGGECEAFAVRFENEPCNGDEVLILHNDDFSVNLYIPLKVLHKDDFIGIRFGNYAIDFSTNNTLRIYKAISDHSTEADTSIELDSTGNIDIKLGTGRTLTVNGVEAAPSLTGQFCQLPNCLYTGSPHTINKITGS